MSIINTSQLLQFGRTARDTFCNSIGQSRCEAAINLASNPAILATMGLVGITTIALITWRWRASVAHSKPVQPEAPSEFSKSNVVITQIYHRQKELIIDKDKEWMGKWLKDYAPYLLDDLRMKDGTEIPIIAGDYLVPIGLNDSNPAGSKSGMYYLPGQLIKQLASDTTLELQYKNQPIQIKASEALSKILSNEIEKLENFLFTINGGFSMKPCVETAHELHGALSFKQTGTSQFPHPAEMKKEEKRGSAEKIFIDQLKNARESQDPVTHFQFAQNKLVPSTEMIPKEITEFQLCESAVDRNRIILAIPGLGKIDFYLWSDYLLICGEPESDEKLSLMEETHSIPDVLPKVYLKDLKGMELSPERLKENFTQNKGYFFSDHGYLYLWDEIGSAAAAENE